MDIHCEHATFLPDVKERVVDGGKSITLHLKHNTHPKP